MKILLLNDNPVVRKLVALSAQKTKDELSVIASVEEVEESEYDLLIVDDGKYSDEVFGMLQEAVRYKSSLLMATRGNAVPAGFENVINKPFLPTDLVEMFVQIEKHLPPEPAMPVEEELSSFDFEEIPESDLQETSKADLNEISDETREINLDDDLDDLEGFDELSIAEETDEAESLIGSGILDEEEVNEVRGLLEDAELDFEDESLDEEIETTLASDSLDDLLNDENDLLSGADEATALSEDEMSLPEEFALDDEFSADALESQNSEEELDLGSLEDMEVGDFASETPFAPIEEEEFSLDGLEEGVSSGLDEKITSEAEEFDFDELASFDEMAEEEKSEMVSAPLEETMPEEMDMDDFGELKSYETEESSDDLTPMSEDEFEELEEQIRSAVEDLDEESLGLEIDELEIPEIATVSEEGDDPFAGLDERSIKLAVGEEVEDLPEEEILSEELLSDEAGEEAEELSMESEETVSSMEKEIGLTLSNESKGTSEGVEAIQALIRTLADEEVAKSLKGLNINININFGSSK